MLRRFLPILTVLAISIQAIAQIPEPIAPSRTSIAARSSLACAGTANAGTTTKRNGIRAKTNDIRYLCLGDTLFVSNTGRNLSEDPVSATVPGIGYLFYDCKPTVSGQRWSDVKNDPCLSRRSFNGVNSSPYIARGDANGQDTFTNNGALQRGFNNGNPIKFYFAPATVYDFFGTAANANGNANFESDTACVNVNVNDGGVDTFSVVYLNAIQITNVALVTGGGSFRVLGGLSEYDGSTSYTISIVHATNPAIRGTVNNNVLTHNTTVTFTVPQDGRYNIIVRDGKSCEAQTFVNFPVVTIQGSSEITSQNDTVCVRISARNFTNIQSWQNDFKYDSSVLRFVGLRNPNPALRGLSTLPGINTNVPVPGVIIFSWNLLSPPFVTVTDNTNLFELCFVAIGSPGKSSTICVSDTLTPIEIKDGAGSTLGFNNICGNVRISTPITVQVSNETVSRGDTACVTVSALGFTNIISFQGTFLYDPNIIEFVGLRNPNLPNLVTTPDVNYRVVSPGVIAFLWFEGRGASVADNVGLFQLCFRAIGTTGSISPVRFTDSLNIIEIVNSRNEKLNVLTRNGSVRIVSIMYNVRISADSVRCNGDSNGGFKIVPTGAGFPWNYSWRSATNPAQNGSGIIAQNDSFRIQTLPAGKYYITVTTSTNTDAKIDSVIIGEPNPLFINPPDFQNPTCAGDSDGSLTLRTFGGGVAPYTFQWRPGGQTSTSITGLPQGAYVCIMTDAKGCKDSVRASIGVNPIAVGTRNIVPATCKNVNNGSILISNITGGTPNNGNYTFRWNTGQTNVGTSSQLRTLIPGTYSVLITDSKGCTKRDTFILGALRTLEATATIGDVTCSGLTNGFIQIVASARGPEAQPYTFTWWGNPGSVSNTAATSLLRNIGANTYTLGIRDADGCLLDTSFIVRQPDSIRLTAIVQNESCRVPNNGGITLTVSGGRPFTGGRYNFTWSHSQTVNTPILTGLPAGTYRVTVTDSTNCIKTDTYRISQPLFPTIDSIAVRNATCSDRQDGAARVFARAPIGLRIDSIRWSNTGFRDSITNVAPGIYSVTVTTNEGCTASLTDTIFAPQPLEIDTVRSQATPPDCPGNGTGTIILILKGGTAPYMYAFRKTVGDTTITTTSNPVFASLAAGTYAFTVTDANGCTPIIHAITLPDPPKINVSFGNLEAVSCYGKCNPGDGIATAIASGGTANTGRYTFIWSSGETCSAGNTCQATNLCGGWQTVSVNDGNCAILDSIRIPQPDSFSFFNPIINQPSCYGDRDGSAEVRVNGGTPPYSFFWSNGSNRSSIVNVPAGNYSVLITDSKLCSFPYAIEITQPQPVVLDTVASKTNNITCHGLSDGQIVVKRTGGNGGPTNFVWSPNVSQRDSAANLKAGTYTIIASDLKGCNDSIQYNLTEPDPIYFFMSPPAQPRCNGELTNIKVDTAFGSTYLYPFSISVDNGPQYPIGFFIPVFAGQHQISIIEQNTGCTLDTTVNINEPPALLIQFDSLTKPNEIARILVGLGDSVRLLSDPRFFSRSRIFSPLPIDSISWTPRDYLRFSNGDSLRPYVRPLDDRTYKLTIFDVNGCSTSEQIFVELDRNRNVFVPNIFTPNGDDRNDFFGVYTGAGVKQVNFMRVFDRWGEILFAKQNIPAGTDPSVHGWDGTFKNRIVDVGVYVYLIEVEFEDGQKLLYRGDITIAR
jgi:gliding motility-associated-like protein